MIAATYTQGKGLRIQDVPTPSVGNGDVLLRVAASAICGTDIRTIRNGHRKLAPGQRIVLGHEFAGTIESSHGDSAFSAGMRVAVAPNVGCGQCDLCARGLTNMCSDYRAFGITWDGGHTEHVRLPHSAVTQGSIILIPEHVSFRDAALIEPLSCVVNGNREARVQFGDVVVVVGAGPIGLLHLQLARLSGAHKVIMADLQSSRLEAAEALGAEVTVNPAEDDLSGRIHHETSGRGTDVVITACSDASVQQQSLEWLAPFGRVCFFGGLNPQDGPVPIDTNAIHYRNLLVTGVTGGSLGDFRVAARLISSRRIDVEKVISHSFTLDDIELAFEQAMRQDAMKVVLRAESDGAEIARG
jgi:2-desacetyl-2-hydroxyethyl bacteriochlorophyllide A dehydrogenase